MIYLQLENVTEICNIPVKKKKSMPVQKQEINLLESKLNYLLHHTIPNH